MNRWLAERTVIGGLPLVPVKLVENFIDQAYRMILGYHVLQCPGDQNELISRHRSVLPVAGFSFSLTQWSHP